MRRDKRAQKSYMFRNIIKTIVFLFLIGIIFYLAPNYVKTDEIKGKVNLIINNNNVTSKLKKDMYVNDKKVIYLSITDVKNYLDKYVYYDTQNKQVITTYGEKIAILATEQNVININNSTLNTLSGIEVKDNEIYLPISQMSNVYNMEMTYITDKNTLVMDSLDKELIKADISQKVSVKYKDTIFSKTVDKVNKGSKVIVVEEKNGWSKIRTNAGKIGYVKTSKLQNKYYVRQNLNDVKKQSTAKINMVWDYFSEYGKAANRSGTTIDGVNVVSPSFFTVVKNGNGKINENVGNNGLNYINWAKQNGYKVWAMVSNNANKDTTSTILNSYTLRTNMINTIVSLANKYNLDGINIDFENMNESDKSMFSRFIIELEPKLKEAGKTLSVDVTAPDGGGDWSECYERDVIGNVADYIVFMAYDQNGAYSSKEGTTAGYNWVETNLNKFIKREEIPSNKIVLGMPFYTRLWKEENGNITSKTVNMKNIDTVIPSDIQRTWDDTLKQNYVEYTQDSAVYKMWIEDEVSIKEKVGLVRKYNLAGVASWEKDREKDTIWAVIKAELENQAN